MNTFEKASIFCHENLFKNQEALNYLKEQRKISKETIDKWQIGLFPSDLREIYKVIDPKELRDAGIIKNASSSTFRVHNLVMPIKDVYGNYIAIGGRTMLPENIRKAKGFPKYMNSIYKKSQHLFGLDYAKKSIVKEDRVFITEGYFDTITPHQNGVENVVSVNGAFLSVKQISLLARYTNNIILMMDNEEEAIKKAEKLLKKHEYEGINFSILNPLEHDKEKDLDEFFRTHNKEDFYERVDGNSKFNNIKEMW